MNILLSTLNAKYIHSSLALRSLKAYTASEFPDIKILEYTIKDIPGHIVADIYRHRPDVIGFSTYIWNIEETISVVQMLKQVLPQTVVILGGPEISYDVTYWMNRIPEVDYLVVGEGEGTFLTLLKRLKLNHDTASVPGTVSRVNDQIQVNPPAVKLDLADIPLPYSDSDEINSLKNRIVYFESSRGCPFSCQFCLSSIESGVRYFPIERVKQRLKQLIDGEVKTIKFVDRTFNLKRDYAKELFQFLIDQQHRTVFQFEITGDILHPTLVDYLVKSAPAGLFRFEIGVQSTNDLTNTLVHRRQNFERLKATVTSIKASGRIVQHLDLIAGLPEEDYGSFRNTFNDVFALEPEELQLGFLKMLRGTGLRQRADQHNYMYQRQAPYEILGNDVLSYGDMLRIKPVEDVLEKYWNDGRLRNTVRFLTHAVFPSAFDFFQAFGTYWEENGWERIGHQLQDLFRRLRQFLATTCKRDDLIAAEAIMSLDYFLSFPVRPHEHWNLPSLPKQERGVIIGRLASHPQIVGDDFARLALDEAALSKHAVIERFEVDLTALLTHHEVVKQPSLLIIYFDPRLAKGQRPQYFVTTAGATNGFDA